MNDFTKINAQHGFMGNNADEGFENHARRCHIHGWHGVFYICSYYSRSMKNKIRKISNAWRKNPSWKQR